MLSAFGLFFYQSLDAIDGKQSRRTNSSSPLGEIFDHGCDAFSTGALTLQKSPMAFDVNSHNISQHLSRFSAFSLCCRGNLHFLWNRPVPELDVLLRFRGDVHVLLRPVADLRLRDHALRPVSCASLPGRLKEKKHSTPPVNVRHLYRIDVTEVQIAIIIIYLMSAVGGVGLWQNTVT